MNDRNFTIVDVETTGGSPWHNRVIEIGAIRVEHGEVVEKFQTLLDPGVSLPEFITKLTGISDADLVGKPSFLDIAEDLFPLFENSVFVAHNSGFDYAF